MNIDWNDLRREYREKITSESRGLVATALRDVAARVHRLSVSVSAPVTTGTLMDALKDVANEIENAAPDPKLQTAVSRPKRINGPHCGESTCLRDHTDMGRCV